MIHRRPLTALAVAAMTALAAVVAGVLSAPPADADPCGMVPPIQVRHDPDRYLTRIGDQLTYVFFKDGVEDVMLRPAFEGRVSEFGMLIPFPGVPAVRKVPEDIFHQVRNAVEPPTVDIDLTPPLPATSARAMGYSGGRDEETAQRELAFDAVQVHREEAVGMYQVAVLEAGSTQALERWMGEHDYVYPDGMDGPVADYVGKGWVFVAIKARVGSVAGIQPSAGMTDADPTLPEDATFDGAVQAMGFRFHVDEPVVPMRLSAFNPGELHNIVYFLADDGVRCKQLPESMVRTQVRGVDLLANMTASLPARITWPGNDGEQQVLELGVGERPRLPDQWNNAWALGRIEAERDPTPHNGGAMEQIAADLMAVRGGTLELDWEADYKRLLNLSEELGMRGPSVDRLLRDVASAGREDAARAALEDLRGMTLTVIEGDFPRDVIAAEDLTFQPFLLPPDWRADDAPDDGSGAPAPRDGRRDAPEDGAGGTILITIFTTAVLTALVVAVVLRRPR